MAATGARATRLITDGFRIARIQQQPLRELYCARPRGFLSGCGLCHDNYP